MLTELAIAISLNTTDLEDFSPSETETQKIVREMFEESYKEKRSILRTCLLYTSPSPRDGLLSRMPSSA